MACREIQINLIGKQKSKRLIGREKSAKSSDSLILLIDHRRS
jgi:hypothetical protein